MSGIDSRVKAILFERGVRSDIHSRLMGGSLLHPTRGRLRRRPQITGTGRSDTAPQYRKMLRGPRSLGNGVPTRPAADVTGARLPNYRWGSAQRISFLQQQGNMRTRPAIAPRSRDNSPGLRPALRA